MLNRLSSIQAVDDRGKALLSSSQPSDCSVIENELADFHQCCRDVVTQLDRYHKKLLQLTVRNFACNCSSFFSPCYLGQETAKVPFVF